jgi:hypothetical protein
VDAIHVAIGEGLIPAGFHAGPDRGLANRNRAGAQRAACLSPATSSADFFEDAHEGISAGLSPHMRPLAATRKRIDFIDR